MAWLPKKTVLVPVDFSDASTAALDVALELAGAPENVHVVHVLPRLSPVEPGVMFGNVTEASRIEKATEAVTKRLAEAGRPPMKVSLRIGSPPKEIDRCARELGADLIVIPAQADLADGVFQLGSTATRVMHMAPCPVLVLKD